MWEELGISGGTAIVLLIALYFIIKWGVKNGVKDAYEEIVRKEGKIQEPQPEEPQKDSED